MNFDRQDAAVLQSSIGHFVSQFSEDGVLIHVMCGRHNTGLTTDVTDYGRPM